MHPLSSVSGPHGAFCRGAFNQRRRAAARGTLRVASLDLYIDTIDVPQHWIRIADSRGRLADP
jgi:hypothetical protein